MSDYGKETVVIVEIDQPLCSREYGDAFVSPSGGCTAVLGSSGARKCYNTASTCQDTANYTPGTLTLRFGRNQEGLLRHYDNVIGAISAIDTTPAAINLGGMDPSVSALGQREAVSMTIDDFKHSDLLVDKYRLQRKTGVASSASPAETFDPYERGTFWGKWLARNPYHGNYALRVREGFMGDALEDMRVRHYLIDRIDGPTNGQVRIVAKDIFSKVEARKAVAPLASRGRLSGDFPSGSPDDHFAVTPTGIGDEDYDPSGYVKIGDEILQFTRSGDNFTVLARAALNTTSGDHKQEDLVQQVLRYQTALAVDIVHDLFCTYSALGSGGSPTESAVIDKAAWDVAAESLTELYTATIATPTPIRDLIGELMLQAGFTVWPNVETGMIEFKVLRAGTSSAVMTDDSFIVDGSLGLAKQVDRRVSQVWVYYAQVDPTKDLENRQNYRSRLADDDVEAESDEQYGAPSIKEIFSRWIPQFGRATSLACAERILAMFRDPPTKASFNLHASRADLVGLARYVTLQTADVQDETGAEDEVQHAITELERGENELSVTTQSVVFYDPGPASGVREIPIENDDYNLNLRTIHDTIYSAPTAVGSPTELTVRFVIESGVTIGSMATLQKALTRGVWPSGIDVQLVNHGRIQGRGATGGQGGSLGAGQPGLDGGDALDCSDGPITVDNTDGEIWSGGGGGGGASSRITGGLDVAGGGGGGGAGIDPGEGGAAGRVGALPGDPGTSEAGGPGGGSTIPAAAGLIGGTGGAPGLAGNNGTSDTYAGGVGGNAGDYIVGNANVIWTALGDVRGGVS